VPAFQVNDAKCRDEQYFLDLFGGTIHSVKKFGITFTNSLQSLIGIFNVVMQPMPSRTFAPVHMTHHPEQSWTMGNNGVMAFTTTLEENLSITTVHYDSCRENTQTNHFSCQPEVFGRSFWMTCHQNPSN
jgi:hypothetical protein